MQRNRLSTPAVIEMGRLQTNRNPNLRIYGTLKPSVQIHTTGKAPADVVRVELVPWLGISHTWRRSTVCSGALGFEIEDAAAALSQDIK